MVQVERFTVERLVNLHNSGGILNSRPSIEPKLLMVDTPDAQEFAAVWQDYLDAKERLMALVKPAIKVSV